MNLKVLISYAYAKSFDWSKIKQMAPQIDLLIDCGAFTAHTKGKKITLEEYYEFLSGIDYPIIGYFALDSIGDAEQTWKNFMHMKEHGFEPMPIFTRGDNLKRLEEYYAHSNIVALGGLWAGGENDPGYVKYIMEEGFRGRRVHWLGFAVHNLLLYFKPYSADVTNWKRALRFGKLVVWTGRGFFEAGRADFARKMPPIAQHIQRLGYDPYLLKKEENWRGAHTLAHEISTVSYLKYTRQLKNKIGTDVYFVCNAQHEIDLLLKLYNKGGYNG